MLRSDLEKKPSEKQVTREESWEGRDRAALVKRITDRDAVEAEMDQFDRLGRYAFLEHYWLRSAR